MVLSHLLGRRSIWHALRERGIRGIGTVRPFDPRQKQGQGRGKARGRKDFPPARRILCLGQALPCQRVDMGMQRRLRPPVGTENPDVAQHDGLARSYGPRPSHGQQGRGRQTDVVQRLERRRILIA
ncbi:hypothetical protein MSKU9_3192 [Komagataeibacter diospyri]|uniref:Uncharacterized protein n=1 Tax=Komagataeibacter diospyri TaxID=1932662 RepID=A0A4P5NYM2_9PROT|nr:hypothetical protein MSKU9_3192 [Komagataeibacter diospyri]